MTIAQRKIELINWITSIENESSIEKLEELKDQFYQLPSEISEVLIVSESTPDSELIDHTSVKDFRREK